MKTLYLRSTLIVLLLLLYNNGIAQITWDTAKALSRHGGYGQFKPSIKSSIIYSITVPVGLIISIISLAYLE